MNLPKPLPPRRLNIAVTGALASGTNQLASALQQTFANGLADEAPVFVMLAPAWDIRLETHQLFDLTLICGLEPAPNDPSKVANEALDAALRSGLQQKGLPFAVVYGQNRERLASALRAIAALKNTINKAGRQDQSEWRWTCDNCSDPGCEHRLFTGRLKIKATGSQPLVP